MKIKKWHFLLGIVISALFLWLAFRKVDLNQVLSVLSQANWAWVAAGIALYLVPTWLRALRWKLLLKPLKEVSLPTVTSVMVIGYMGNNIYPARAGEVLRSILLKQKEDIEISASLATIVVERLFDAIVVMGLVLLNLGTLTAVATDAGMVAGIQRGAVIGAAVFFLALFLFLAMVVFPDHTQRFFGWFIQRLIPFKARPAFTNIVQRFLNGLMVLRSPVETFKVFLLSVGVWVTEGGLYWALAKALNLDISFGALLLLIGVVNLVLLIPAAPGGLGTFDAAGKSVLQLFGIAPDAATGYSLLLRAALWIPLTVLGLILFMKEGLSLRSDLGALQAEYRAEELQALTDVQTAPPENMLETDKDQTVHGTDAKENPHA